MLGEIREYFGGFDGKCFRNASHCRANNGKQFNSALAERNTLLHFNNFSLSKQLFRWNFELLMKLFSVEKRPKLLKCV